ncbi:MAG: pyruvate carboxylase [Proteobacteria bacterium]|nr:pyruvate carboxylase [Pseudomonadota bacterium]
MKTLLALNRGEIAIRILRAANELGLRTVAVFSQEDRLSLHRFKADEAYLVGQGKGPVQAYLDVDGIVAMAAEKGVDAIHPGYGFLAENPALARACARAGITFVGPSADLLELLGDKTAARNLAIKAGLPVIKGTAHPVTDDAEAMAVAAEIGFPIMVKAAFGGGGRGMRIARTPEELPERLREARREAGAAFGNDAVFLERYIAHARHIEVQIIADRDGNVLHLHERDCSVQRRHQKVVEIAPAFSIKPSVRAGLCDAAVRLAKAAGYENAGTVEFLVDAETDEFFFIEVNPRVQVEHTVTEMVTGVDVVATQILISQGHALHGPVINLPQQSEIPLHGFALQCRVTTEDPTRSFIPDYGKIHTYRSPAGFGIRLDGASAYGGAVITPYYDSLLVKVTAWGRDFSQACRRMDRALREFRIRGVKTNIQFLQNVVNHPQFLAGEVTTSFLDQTPQLFTYKPLRDRATRLLSYLGEVIVNGNPEVADKPRPAIVPAAVPARERAEPPPGTKQKLDALGPEGFARWMKEQKPLLFTDTTFRDAHQSLLATRVRTYDMLAIANHVSHRLPSLFSLEMWGGATFDVALRFLLEDPWERLRLLRAAIPNICFQMLLRASNAVGYTAYPDNVVVAFIKESAAHGMDIFRIFDSLNWLPNMRIPIEAVRDAGKVAEAAICYTGDILDPREEKYTLKYYVRLAKALEKMGAHILGIKDMAGLLRPYAAQRLVQVLRDEVDLPIHFHTHDTSGINAASVLRASDAGVHAVDAAIASMSGTTSQPNMNSLVAALQSTERDPGLDFDALNVCADYWETVRTWYAPFDGAPPAGTGEVYVHQMPGGQYTNLWEQAKAMGLGTRWPDIKRAYADVNHALGDIVKVTPSSKVVGDLAVYLVSHNLTVADLLALGPDHTLTLPNSLVDMLNGSLGVPEGGWPQRMLEVGLRGKAPMEGRPGENLAAVDLEAERIRFAQRVEADVSNTDLMSALMYPEVFVKFAQARARYGNLEVLPTPQFFYGLEKGEEVTVELEPGKILIIRFLAVGDPQQDGTRIVFFELNGQPREVTVRDRSLKDLGEARIKADSGAPGQVGAPIPGAVTAIYVEAGQKVAKGDPLFVMEAMKMQTTVYAPVAGTVSKRVIDVGRNVEAKDLVLVLDAG